ncbi:MAG: phenylalanine--tRNA ligase subunit beta [Gemmatimonadota bacterium]
MNVSVNWLRELVPGLDDAPEALAARFSMVAAAVEGIEPVGDGLDEIVVARVLRAEKHPNADRLSLCVVDVGKDEPVVVVCGAPVIIEGALYPYVPVGATLPAGFTIEARKIRGEMSSGMLCSEIELDLGRDKSGIMRLPDDLEPGTPLTEVLGLPDVRLGLDLNPNRVDLACHLGVAREFAGPDGALNERDFGTSWSPEWVDGDAQAVGAGVSVVVEAPDRCPRYLAAVVRGVKVGPSPAWLVGRLLAVGARPINNVVDATNYVLLERNQPLHAFDLRKLEGSEIRVRAAADGETLETLDGERRTLSAADTVIADGDRAIALAGVMGGADTEVSSDTVDVLIECASFDPLSVRKTSRSVGLSTEASYRFERGIDGRAQETALARCVELILAIAGGEADDVGIRVGNAPQALADRPLRAARVKQVLGLDLSDEEIAALLEPIGFRRRGEAGPDGAVMYGVPGWRGDVTREIDLVEEVARRFGYDNFPDEDRRFRSSTVPEHPGFEQADRARRLLVGRGLFEARSLSFVPEEHRGNRASVAIPNPLSAEESYLRGGLVPVLLRRTEHNYSRGRRDVRLFEVGTVFDVSEPVDAPSGGDDANRNAGLDRYVETLRLGFVVTGARDPAHWSGAAPDFDVWDVKALAEEIATDLCNARVVPFDDADDAVADSLGGSWIAPDSFRIVRDDVTVGVAGAVLPSAIDAPPWAAAAWGLEMTLAAIAPRAVAAYRTLSAYPAVRRDLAITVPVEVPAAEVDAVVRETASALLESARLFDVYEGDGVGEGRRSLGWAFRFRADDRTLTDEDVEAEMNGLSEALEKRFDARIRSS